MKRVLCTLILVAVAPITHAAPPGIINHQGRIAVGGVNFDGTGHFKFALVDGAGAISFWSNDGTSSGGGEPTASIAIPVSKGHYAVALGETGAIPGDVFADNDDVQQRVWFSQTGGAGTFEQLAPDRRLSSAGYALSAQEAQRVADGAITAAMLGDGAVGSAQLADGAVSLPKLATTLATRLAATLDNPSPGSGDQFGFSVAGVGTDKLLVGAPGDDTGASGAGSAYLFDLSGNLLATLDNPSPGSGDNFGISVAGVGADKLLVGAFGDDTGATNAGSAYLYQVGGAVDGLVAHGVVDRSLTEGSFATGAVTSEAIADGSITGADIANGSISGADIADGSITGTNIANGTITGADITGGTLVLGGSLDLGGNQIANAGELHVSGSSTHSAVFEKSSVSTNSLQGVFGTQATSSGNMANGFGASIEFAVEDNAGTPNNLGGIGAVRAGADNTGDLVFYNRVGGAFRQHTRIGSDGVLYIGEHASNDDDYIRFDAGGDYLRWDDSADRFQFSDDLVATSFNPTSDRDAKEAFEAIDPATVLEKVSQIPITTWRFKDEGREDVRHLGPMAQDFHAAFGLGHDDRHISTTDADGVALAAIQALKAENDQLKKQNAAILDRLAQIEAAIAAKPDQ